MNVLERKTQFSPNRQYRYTLWREWDMMNPGYAMFIGLNPSTADEVQDDPTIRRCINFAKRWNLGALCMTNIFGFRATNPKVMFAADEPIGPENDMWIYECAMNAQIVVAAWGNLGALKDRADSVLNLLRHFNLKCLGITLLGHPKHPLYVRSDTTPISFKR